MSLKDCLTDGPNCCYNLIHTYYTIVANQTTINLLFCNMARDLSLRDTGHISLHTNLIFIAVYFSVLAAKLFKVVYNEILTVIWSIAFLNPSLYAPFS